MIFLLLFSVAVSGQTISRVQSKSGNTGSSASTSIAVTLNSAPVNGNTLIAVIATRGTSSGRVTGITQTGATWTRATQATNSNSGGSTLEIWYASNVSSAGTLVTVTQANLRSAIVVAEYSGVLTASSLDVIQSNSGSSTSASTGTTVTTTQADELLIGGFSLASSSYTLSSITNSFASYGNNASTNSTSGNNAKVYALDRIVSSTGAYSTGGTISTNSKWAGAIATFKAKATSSTSVVSSDNTSTYGTNATFTATVTPDTATGLVEFYDGTTLLGTETLSGTTTKTATYTPTATQLSVGSHSITATYIGNGSYFTSTSSAITQTVTALAVQLSGTREYDGTVIANSSDLSISNNLDGANLTLSGKGILSSKDVGTRTISSPPTSRIQSTTGSVNSGSSITMTALTSAPIDGNTLIAVISTRGTSANKVSSITQTGASWSRVSQAANTNGSTTEIWYAPNVSSAAKNITISLSSSLRAAAVVMEYEGLLTANSVDQTASTTGSGVTASTGTTATTEQDNELLIAGVSLVNSGYSLSGITNSFTTIANVTSTSGTASNNTELYALEKIVTTASTYTTGGTVSTSSQWSGTIATFKSVLPTGSALTLSGSAAANYTLSGFTGSMIITARPLTITANSDSKCQGTAYTLSSSAFTSTGLQNNETLGSVTLSCSGANANAIAGTYDIVPSAAIGGTFTDSNYSISYVNGALTVNPALHPSVSIVASESAICTGTSVTFTATPTNGGTTPSYQWKLNGNNVGTDSATYTSSALTNNDAVSVVMTSNATTCLTVSTATSNTVTITINTPIAMSAITPGVIHLSSTATTTITASGVTGSNAVVSWYTGTGQVGLLGTGLTSPAVGYGTYYAVVTGSCGTPVEISTTIRRLNVWTGAVNNFWHIHGNWSEGINPDADTDAFIGTGKVVEINNDQSHNVAFANTLTIEGTGVLTVKSGFNLTLTNGFTTAAATSLVLESNANLIQVNSVVNTTPITVKRATSPLKRLDYILWSSPVIGQNMLAFSPLTTLSPTIRFYTYNTTTNYYNSVPSPSTTNFDAGKGALIRLPYNHPTTAAAWTGTFAGVPNNGTITVPLVSDATDATKRYNVIGNPYPSTISIQSFIDGNVNNIEGPLYFWRKTNGSTNKSYWAISKGGYTSSGEGTNPGDAIQVGQGFIVQAKANATQVVFDNSMRITNNNNQFFKTTNNGLTNNASRVWLKLTDAAGDYSQALIGYFDDATLGVDDGIDAKDINDGVIGINSVINNVDYTIQGRPTFSDTDVVPLSYKVTTAGSYTISIDQVDGLFTGGAQNVFLRDNVLGTCNNLTTSPYTFASNAGSFENRFELLYQNSLLSNNNPQSFNANYVVVYHQKSDLVINTGEATMSSIKVFNIKGALLFSKKEINASETRINIGSTNEVLLVEIVTAEGIKVVKKVYSELVIGSDDDE